MKKIKLAFLLVGSTILFSGFFPSDTDIYFRISKSIETFGKVYKEITLNYVDKINPEEFALAGVKGMLSQLDPYTNYIDSQNQRDLDIITSGKYGGIGLTVSFTDENVTVVNLADGYSAQKTGIRLGDVIKKVNDVELTKNNSDYLSIIQKGDPGTYVSLTIKREGVDSLLHFNVVRQEIEISNLDYYGFMPENSGNAYLKLSGFARPAGNEVKKALEELSGKRKIESIVLDLRGNPGGLLEAAVNVCEKFLKKGSKVVSVIGRDSLQKKDYYSTEEPLAGNVPLAVLVDNGSASASEIVAGAIQDHDRGVIVGEPTFGKGLVQTVVPLTDNSSLKMTTARYYTPSGRCIQKISYSENNKVFELQGINKINAFYTDRKREVYSAGGIKPDSVTGEGNLSQIEMKLLTDGMFFKFATHYFNANPAMQLKDINDEALFNSFAGWLKEKKFQFIPRAEMALEQLKKTMLEGSYPKGIETELNHIQAEIDKTKQNELAKNKHDIVMELRDELVDRILGSRGMIKESLKEDKTFKTAYSILTNKKLYNKLLNINE